MGILFNKKSDTGAVVNRRMIKDHDLSRGDIRAVAKQASFARGATRRQFKEMLTQAQHGGLTRDEVHTGLQDMIRSGDLTRHKAAHVAKRLGLERKDLHHFRDMSESIMDRRRMPSDSAAGGRMMRPSTPSLSTSPRSSDIAQLSFRSRLRP